MLQRNQGNDFRKKINIKNEFSWKDLFLETKDSFQNVMENNVCNNV